MADKTGQMSQPSGQRNQQTQTDHSSLEREQLRAKLTKQQDELAKLIAQPDTMSRASILQLIVGQDARIARIRSLPVDSCLVLLQLHQAQEHRTMLQRELDTPPHLTKRVDLILSIMEQDRSILQICRSLSFSLFFPAQERRRLLNEELDACYPK